MDDEEGMEDFSINDTDLAYAMNPGRRRYQTKEQAALGVWADSDDDSEFRPTFGKRSKTKDYSSGVAFVSGGIKGGNQGDAESSTSDGTKTKEDAPIEINFTAKHRPSTQKQRQTGAQVFAGLRSSATRSTVDDSKFADWARISGKGDVIMKMMKTMGWSHGEGLGKEGQGIVEPIKSGVRPGRGAVGAYGREVNSSGPKFGESSADAQRRITEESGSVDGVREARVAASLPKGSWKKTAKVKTIYKTIDDVIKEGGGPVRAIRGGRGSKVIDMTGPEQRVYSGYDAFAMKTKAECEDDSERHNFDVPEITHNINILLDLTEEDIRRTNHQLGTVKDQTVALEHDLGLAKEELSRAENEFDRMKSVYALLEDFVEQKNPSMNKCQALFQRLKRDFRSEYQLYHLEAAAIPLVLPLISSFFARWRALDPDHLIYGIDLMKEWKEVLDDGGDGKMFSNTAVAFDRLCAFDRLLWDGWMPSIRRAVLTWDPKTQFEQMVRVIETWLPVLPTWMRDNLLDQVVVPKIVESVENWDPLQDKVPIHLWLVPWLHTLGDRLVPVFAPIRQKLAKALRLWNPLDRGALVMLRPWVSVWTQATMAAFCAQNIVPKLERCLETMSLDPNVNGRYPEFDAVVDWLEIINADTIVNVITRYFFPRWFETLCAWLDTAPGDAIVQREVKAWYMQWKSKIPARLIEQFPVMEANIRRALVALHQSSKGVRVGTTTTQPIVIEPPPPPPPPRPTEPSPKLAQIGSVQMSTREILERESARNGLTFVPQQGRIRDGHQVFWFGTTSIYVSGGIVYAWDTSAVDWYPITIGRLLRDNGVPV